MQASINENMKFSIDEKRNMSIELFAKYEKGEWFKNLSSKAEIIHRSLWAVTIRDQNYIYKAFYYKNLEKIKQEILLLNLMGKIKAELNIDNQNDFIYSKAKYLELKDLEKDCSVEWLYRQLKGIFNRWLCDKRFIQGVKCTWESESLPYMIYVLHTYLPGSERYIDYLRKSKPVQFIHGDFTISNIKIIKNELIVLDFELSTIGPELWDEETFLYSLVEAELYELADKMFELLGCTKEGVACIAAIKLAIAYKKESNIKKREKAFKYITETKWR